MMLPVVLLWIFEFAWVGVSVPLFVGGSTPTIELGFEG